MRFVACCRHLWFTGRIGRVRAEGRRCRAARREGWGRGVRRARARDGARCSARSSLARAATSQSGAGCGDVNCIGTGREFSVGRDVSCSFVSSACAEPCVIECLCLSRRRPRSSLRGPVAAFQPTRTRGSPKWWVRSKLPIAVCLRRPSCLLFLSTCRSYPTSRSHATLSIVFCFQNADTYVDRRLPIWSRPRGRVFVRMVDAYFFVVYFCR